MTFGNKQRVAIEVEFAAETQGASTMVRIRYWFCGDPVGMSQDDDHAPLRIVLTKLSRFSYDAGKRNHSTLFTLGTTELIERLDAGLYLCADAEAFDLAQGERWANHNVSVLLDESLDWKVYVVENEKVCRICYRHLPTDEDYECDVLRGEFDRVLTACVVYLEDIEREANLVNENVGN